MTFNSIEFLIFYPSVLFLYYLMPRRAAWPVLLISSYFFYMCYNPSLVFLIFGTTLVSWVSSILTEGTEKLWLRRLYLGITLISSLGVLFFYKYFNFISLSISSLFGGEGVTLDLLLPVGISFYTFQTLSYVIDVYRRNIKAERNFFFYALFVSFFPQLVAGPIERPDNLIPQLRERKKWNSEDAAAGVKFMLLGFFKKICVADVVSGAVNNVFNNPQEQTTVSIVIATCLFAIQIYCDFSGYTDIAIGCARVMGIRLMKNFDHPYSATNIKEFWAGWHISLSTWFRDYLYIPLGGNRKGRVRGYVNLFIVFLVSGLWHGASWTFVIWGALHGVYRIVGGLTAAPRRRLIEKLGFSESSRPVVYVRRVITFVLVGFAWIFFRANSIADIGILYTRMFTSFGSLSGALSAMELDGALIAVILCALVLLWMLDRILPYGGEAEKPAAIMVRGGSYVYFIWVILLCWILLYTKDMVSTFIYFQF